MRACAHVRACVRTFVRVCVQSGGRSVGREDAPHDVKRSFEQASRQFGRIALGQSGENRERAHRGELLQQVVVPRVSRRVRLVEPVHLRDEERKHRLQTEA